jgi:homoserine dehydrogenase
MTKPINIGLFGLGTVGSGVAKVLTANAVNIAHKIGAPVRIKTVLVRNPAKARSDRKSTRLNSSHCD